MSQSEAVKGSAGGTVRWCIQVKKVVESTVEQTVDLPMVMLNARDKVTLEETGDGAIYLNGQLLDGARIVEDKSTTFYVDVKLVIPRNGAMRLTYQRANCDFVKGVKEPRAAKEAAQAAVLALGTMVGSQVLRDCRGVCHLPGANVGMSIEELDRFCVAFARNRNGCGDCARYMNGRGTVMP